MAKWYDDGDDEDCNDFAHDYTRDADLSNWQLDQKTKSQIKNSQVSNSHIVDQQQIHNLKLSNFYYKPCGKLLQLDFSTILLQT